MRKNKFIVTLCMAGVISLGFTACGNPKQDQDSQTVSLVPESITLEATQESQTDLTSQSDREQSEQTEGISQGLDNFNVEEKTVSEFAQKVKDAIAQKDIEALADLTAFPTYVGFPEEGIVINTREEFLKLDTEKIFTQDMLTSIENTDISALQASMAGFTMYDEDKDQAPSITFGMTNGALGINGINY